MRLILTIVITAATLISSGQNIYFENRFDNHPDSTTADLCMGSFALDTGGYILCGAFEYFFSNERYGSIARVDKDGNVIQKSYFGWIDKSVEIYKIHETSSGEYIALGNYADYNSSNGISLIIASIDPVTLDTNWTKIINSDSDTTLFYGYSDVRNDSLFVTGTTYVWDSMGGAVEIDAFLSIFDLNANEIFREIWGVQNEHEYFGAFVFTDDHGLAITADATGYSTYRRNVIVKMDETFNIEWIRLEGSPNYIGKGGGILNTADGNIIICYDEVIYPVQSTVPDRRTRVKKLTYNNNVVWSTLLYPLAAYISSGWMIEDSDSNILISWQLYENHFAKLSSAGELIWERSLEVGDGSHMSTNLVHGNDEGYLLTGFYSAPPGTATQFDNQDTYLIKTNCMGFSSPPIADAISSTGDNFEVVIDNNSQYYDYAIWNWGDGTIDTTYNNEDRWGYTPDTLVSHVYGTQGVYNVTLIVGACGDEDTVQVIANAAISSTESIEKGLVKVYPNPASNFLTVENLQRFGSAKFVLYNSLGKEVLRSDIGNNKIKRIQLENLNNGLYLYRIVGNDKAQSGSLIITR